MRLVLVVWLDAVSEDASGWKSLDLIRKQRPPRIESVGWVLCENDEFITLVSSKDNEDCDGDVTIPSGMIISIHELMVRP